MNGFRLACVLLVAGCAAGAHTCVVVPYTGAPIQAARVEVVNATGHDLPLPQAGIVEQAVRAITGLVAPEHSVADVFAREAESALAARGIDPHLATTDRLRISLENWDVRDGTAAGGVAFVSARYQLIGSGDQVRWDVEQIACPVRLSGANFDRTDVHRIARACIDAVVATAPGNMPAAH